MDKRHLGRTGLKIAPLVFGGNVFGWTVNEQKSFEILDHFAAAGLNAIDTADVYSAWAPGNKGGESETIIGRWLARVPGRRGDTVIITKAGGEIGPFKKNLKAAHILAAAEDSLRRLQTDYIDVYLSHWPDDATPIDETLGAYEKLLVSGKVRSIGASNYDARQLSAALQRSAQTGIPRYQVLEPEYNLYRRAGFEGELRDLCIREHVAVITYFSLASGFLSGKYRSASDLKGARGSGMSAYLNDRGLRILAALDEVAEAQHAKPAEVALAWLMAQPGVTAPIASATSIAQVDSLVRATQLQLKPSALERLTRASD